MPATIVRRENGGTVDWPIKLDAELPAELAKWRRHIELRLHFQPGSLMGLQWDEAGDLALVVRFSPTGS